MVLFRVHRSLSERGVQRFVSGWTSSSNHRGSLRPHASRPVYRRSLQRRLLQEYQTSPRRALHRQVALWRQRTRSRWPTSVSARLRVLLGGRLHLCWRYVVSVINTSAYRPIGRYRRSKHRKLVTSLKPVANATLRRGRTLILTLTLTLNPNFHHFAHAISRSQPETRTADDVMCKAVSEFLCFERR